MATRFVDFGPSHLIAIALILAVACALTAVRRLRPAVGTDRAIRGVLAVFLAAMEVVWLWLLERNGWMQLGNVLPMQLCDWAAIAAFVTLIRPGQRSYELAYFWALGGTLQALLTPALAVGFPDARFLIFFAFHGGIIVAVLYLTFGARMRPVVASIPRVIMWTLGYAAAALATNFMFGTNFGFLAAKPPQASLLSYLAPWPYYILQLVPIALGVVAILYAPFLVADLWRRQRGPYA